MLQPVVGILASLLKSYLVKLATKEFAHWVFFQVAEALVKMSKTKEDDRWLEKIKETVEKD